MLATTDVQRFIYPVSVAMSPAGDRVAFCTTRVERDQDRDVADLWICATEAGGTPSVVATDVLPGAPTFAADGSAIFFRALEGGVPHVFVQGDGATNRTRITAVETLPRGAGPFTLSPDGTRFAFAAAASVPTSREQDNFVPRVLNSMTSIREGGAVAETQIYVGDVRTGECRQLTHSAGSAAMPTWSPQGDRIAYVESRTPEPGDSLIVSQACVIAVDGSTAPVRFGQDTCVASPPGWWPDGQSLFAVSEPPIAHRHSRLLRLHQDGAPDEDLLGELDRNVMLPGLGYPGCHPILTSDGKSILACVRDRGCTHLYQVSVGDGRVSPILAREGTVVSAVADGNRGEAVVAFSDASSFGEIGVVNRASGELRVLTDFTARTLGSRQLGTPDTRDFEISDGTRVQGWLLLPASSKGPYPLVVDIHGGPHNAWSGTLDPARFYQHDLADRGWAVLTVNSRGSDGYGQDFYSALAGNWGFADEADILEPVRDLIAEGVADPDRLALVGYSYGGYMTCHLTTRAHSFIAAVAGGSLCDLPGTVGSCDEGWNTVQLELRSNPYSGRAALADRSPTARASHVSTPTLLLHGEDDRRCRISQAEHWLALLLGRGVPAELVAYPGADHSLINGGRPSHRLDYQARLVAWLERWRRAADKPEDEAGS